MEGGGDKLGIRSFDWRDLLLLQRMQGQGQILDFEGAGVDGVFPLRDALHAYLLLGAGTRRTLVMPGMNAFAQYFCLKGSNRVHLVFIAPAPTNAQNADCWLELLDQLTAAVGAKGIHHIVAEAEVDSPELDLLQRVGFGVFARQMLFQTVAPPQVSDHAVDLPGLRLWRSADDWGLRLLYSNIVPQLAQQIEAPSDTAFGSSRWPNRLVLEREGEIIASLATRRGRVGSALRLLLHPKADAYVEALICRGVKDLAGGQPQSVYCRVRRYESWLQAPLEACGFELVARTALLVKHTVARVITPEWQRAPVMEGRAEVTTPMAHANLQRPFEG